MRAGVLTHESFVRLAAESFVPLMLDTGTHHEYAKMAKRHGYRGAVPFLAIISPEGKTLRQVRMPGRLLRRMRALLEEHPNWDAREQPTDTAGRARQAFAHAEWHKAAELADDDAGADPALALLAAAARVHALQVPAEQKLLRRLFFALRDRSFREADPHTAHRWLDRARKGIGKDSALRDDLLLESARLALAERDSEAAEKDLTELLAAFPQSDRRGEAYWWLGLIHHARGETEKALFIWQTGRETAPDSLFSLRSKLLTIGGRKL